MKINKICPKSIKIFKNIRKKDIQDISFKSNINSLMINKDKLDNTFIKKSKKLLKKLNDSVKNISLEKSSIQEKIKRSFYLKNRNGMKDIMNNNDFSKMGLIKSSFALRNKIFRDFCDIDKNNIENLYKLNLHKIYFDRSEEYDERYNKYLLKKRKEESAKFYKLKREYSSKKKSLSERYKIKRDNFWIYDIYRNMNKKNKIINEKRPKSRTINTNFNNTTYLFNSTTCKSNNSTCISITPYITSCKNLKFSMINAIKTNKYHFIKPNKNKGKILKYERKNSIDVENYVRDRLKIAKKVIGKIAKRNGKNMCNGFTLINDDYPPYEEITESTKDKNLKRNIKYSQDNLSRLSQIISMKNKFASYDDPENNKNYLRHFDKNFKLKAQYHASGFFPGEIKNKFKKETIQKYNQYNGYYF